MPANRFLLAKRCMQAVLIGILIFVFIDGVLMRLSYY
jgi:hypothetical protein